MSNGLSRLTRYVACPSCATELRVPASHPAGAQVQCGACARVFRAPAPDSWRHVPDNVSDTGPLHALRANSGER